MAPVGSFFARSRHLALFAAFPALGLVVVVGQAVLLSGCDGGSAGAAAAATAPTVQMTQAQSAFFATHPQLKVVWDHGVGVPASMRGFTSPMVGDPAGAATRFLEGIKDVLKLGDVGAQMKVRRVQRDDLGYEHVRFSQVHEGLSVIGAEVIVHSDRLRRIYQVDTKIYPDPDVSLIPSVTAEKALARGRGDFASKKTLRVSRGPTLVVYPWGSQKTYLAWTYALSFGEPGGSIGHWIYFVDAHSGRVLTRFNDIQTIAGPTTNGTHTDVTGNRLAGEDGASVTVQGWRDDTNSAWYLYNKYENWYIYNHWHWAPTYTDDNTFAHRTANASWGTSDQALISLANNFHSIQQFCQGVLGWNSFDNLGRVAVVNGHYSETGSAFLNAFYSGDFADPTNNVTPRMFYFGDGDGVLYNPLVSLDITAHEFGHGITHHSSNLVYANESGALNESFSDIYGAACEFQVQPDGRSSYPGSQAGRADWLMGEDATVHSWATAGRDMRNPGSTTTLASGSQQPSRYHGVYWYTGTGDNGGVHRNSGPQNFVYYLLSEGGSGLNDGLPYSLTGIGWLDAARVAHRANTAYLTQGSTYGNARNAWISAATDLQGGSDWVTPVGQAFDAIGVTGVPAAVTEGFEGGTIPAGWDTSGAATWSVTTTHIEGAQAVRAGAIVDSQASHLTTTVNTTHA
ncbi:MAG: M4 family metallopeptidase [Candidatus Riflebacteria bacterium]|nr:M4 family metallopeptidase [Candidatus Riflebacteria bacterium]